MSNSAPRITTRVDNETQKLLSEAAAVTGTKSINSFVLAAAVEKARQIMDRERSLRLNRQDASRLIEALDSPPRIHSRLREAADRYERDE
ncbi:MAG TPA: DUF1778 domain-containing protein [Desulfomicrobiaceae bacterium]|nr:DUF1778 domain-containing protein [Desulfomicrobiaceae bacterium]